MRLLHSDGREVNTGDIVWKGRRSYIFLSIDGTQVEVKTTDDRRMFVRGNYSEFNLTLEAL